MHQVLQLVKVSHTYGEGRAAVRALRGINLALRGGEVMLLEGPSGSGKTTLLLIAGALMHPTAGRVLLLGEEVSRLGERELPRLRRSRLGYIFQAFNLLDNLSALENVATAGFIASRSGAVGRAKELLNRFGLSDRLRHLPSELSGGEKQRVGIARALMNDPQLIVADEPTANLDSTNGREVMALLKAIAKSEDRGVLIASHDPRVRRFADRRLRLVDGQIVR